MNEVSSFDSRWLTWYNQLGRNLRESKYPEERERACVSKIEFSMYDSYHNGVIQLLCVQLYNYAFFVVLYTCAQY